MSKLKIKSWLAFGVLVVLFATNTYAANICLYARSDNDITSGHSYVVIWNNNAIVETYGFWPTSKHVGSIAINKSGDLPLDILREKYTISDRTRAMTEEELCKPFQMKDLEKLRTKVKNYTNEYDVYRQMSNNCTHFAIRIYNFATGDNFPVVQTPKKARKIMSQIEEGLPN